MCRLPRFLICQVRLRTRTLRGTRGSQAGALVCRLRAPGSYRAPRASSNATSSVVPFPVTHAGRVFSWRFGTGGLAGMTSRGLALCLGYTRPPSPTPPGPGTFLLSRAHSPGKLVEFELAKCSCVLNLPFLIAFNATVSCPGDKAVKFTDLQQAGVLSAAL